MTLSFMVERGHFHCFFTVTVNDDTHLFSLKLILIGLSTIIFFSRNIIP